MSVIYSKNPIADTTDAVTVQRPINTAGAHSIVVSANNLAGAEEADLYVKVGAGWEVLVDAAGTARKLTAAITMLTLDGGPRYGVTKDLTAGACGIYVSRRKA